MTPEENHQRRDSLKSNTSMDSNRSTNSLDAIRARRAKLEALTAQMKLPQLMPVSSHGRRPLPEYDFKYSLYPERKSAKLSRNRRKASAAVKLEPLDRPVQENELDRRAKDDTLIKQKNKSKDDDELLNLWRNQDRLDDSAVLNQKPKTSLSSVTEDIKDEENDHKNKKGNSNKRENEFEENDKSPVKEAKENTEDIKGENMSSTNPPPPPKPVTDKTILEAIEMLKSEDENIQAAGAQMARRDLANSNCPPIDDYVNAGILPLLNACLAKDSNSTLQFECLWALTNIASGTTEQSQMICDAECLPEVVKCLGSSDDKVADQAVWTISNIAGDSSSLRDQVVAAGALPQLQKLIHRKPSSVENSLFFLKNLSWVFSNILRHKPLLLTPEQVSICVEAVTLFVHHPDQDIHRSALWSLAYVGDGGNDQIQKVVDAGVLPRLVELLGSSDDNVVAAALRASGNVLTGNDLQTDEVISAGIMRPLIKLMDNPKKSVKKEAIWSLSNILAGTVSQIEVAVTSGVIFKLTTLIIEDKEHISVLKECVWCLANLADCGSQDHVEKLVYYDGVKAFAKAIKYKDIHTVRIALEGICNLDRKLETVGFTIKEEISKKDLENIDRSAEDVTPLIDYLLGRHYHI